MESLKRLNEVLGRRFPGEQTTILAAVLATASKKGRISYEEIDCGDDIKRNLLLLAYRERLLLPVKTSDASISLAWQDRILTAKPGEIYEMPNVIRHLINHAKETGEWNPELAVEKYLEEIAEPDADEMLTVFKEIRREIKSQTAPHATVKITPHLMKQAAEKHKLKVNMNKLIVEFKGGGIINPHVDNPSKEGITYEVNLSLL
ncbi:MAG: hypothetical protein QXD34_03115 [Candidatus Bathyarchaeia archaeon]